MMYVKHPLSLRNVEGLFLKPYRLARAGIGIRRG
jgi:hypothetical protein